MRSRFLFVALALAGCATTQELAVAPSIDIADEEFLVATDPAPSSSTGSLGLVVTDHESDSLESLEVLPGARISEVVPGGAADGAGLEVGDVILTVNGIEVHGREAFVTTVRSASDGDRLALQVRRDTVAFAAELMVPRIATGQRPKEIFRVDPVLTRAGYRSVVVTLQAGERVALEVVKIFPKSPLPVGEVTVGDHIVALDGQPVESAHHFVRRLLEDYTPGQRVRLDVLRADGVEVEKVRLWKPRKILTDLSFPIVFNYRRNVRYDTVRWSLLDFWVFSLFGYEREKGEKKYNVLFFEWGTGFGELVEEPR